MDPQRFYNKGLRSFGAALVTEYLSTMLGVYGKDTPVVSVGSGMGAYEYVHPEFNWVMVDPDPTSFAFAYSSEAEESVIDPFRSPDYRYVSDAIREKPALVRNCIVFLNWCDPELSTYDYDAIRDLEPMGVLAIVEKFAGGNGAAGSFYFHNLLDHSARSEGQYRLRMQCKLKPMVTGAYCMDMRLAWLTRADLDTTAELELPRLVCSKINHNPAHECCVM